MLLLGVLAAQAEAAAPAAAGSYDLLETEILTGSQSSVTFSSLNSTYGADYQHLQIRWVMRDNRAISGSNNFKMTFNGDTGSNYADHQLAGTGSSVASSANSSQSSIVIGYISSASDTADAWGAGTIDLLDAFNTSKYTTARAMSGLVVSAATSIRLLSGLWMNTNALTSVTLTATSASFIAGSRISLYGWKAA